MTTVRERLEMHRAAGYGSGLIWHLLGNGSLLPADEADARIEAAVAVAEARERERIALDIEAWASGSGSNLAEVLHRLATTIRSGEEP